jgi:release factor glutamine methyltransferase
VAGADGLDDLRRIVAAAPGHLSAAGWLVLEHGHDQAAAVQALLSAAGLVDVCTRQDLAGLDRCTAARATSVTPLESACGERTETRAE